MVNNYTQPFSLNCDKHDEIEVQDTLIVYRRTCATGVLGSDTCTEIQNISSNVNS